ncbi:MAG: hypothetical protein P4L85_16050 [Paludisphaera borealis]|uniref:hypothetical protein n=1 Tax=Paludisphaera borealis TaxID=1387353 RepID=UPI00283C5534|nr:hypothetical protein [Paludisphaera borealis]MDR3620865.1 hypothetical protein [Paludisphaera borealis]
MDRIQAYSVLAQELERFRRLPYEELVRRIDSPTTEKTVRDEAGPLVIEVRVEWADAKEGPVRIRAIADGPSWWRLERLEESILVSPPAVEE